MSFTPYYKIVVGFCLGLLLMNCQDKQSEKNKNTSLTNKETVFQNENDTLTTIDTTEISSKKEKVSDTNKKSLVLTNKNMKSFLLDYGKKHPENKVQIETKFGNIIIQLYPKTPLHRANFLYLVNQKYFNETFFYRVAKGFVIQGGNSDREAMARKRFEIGDDYTVPQEQVAGLSHDRGAVALSKQWVDNPSNRSTPFEFFIVVAKNGAHHLDGEHTIFGKVIKGMEVVDKINNVPVDGSEWPLENIFIKAKVIE